MSSCEALQDKIVAYGCHATGRRAGRHLQGYLAPAPADVGSNLPDAGPSHTHNDDAAPAAANAARSPRQYTNAATSKWKCEINTLAQKRPPSTQAERLNTKMILNHERND